MGDLAMTTGYDIAVTESGDIATISDKDELTQLANMVLQTRKYDYEPDITFGNDVFNRRIGGGTSNDDVVLQDCTNALLSIPSIESVDDIRLSKESDGTRILYTITNIDGVTAQSDAYVTT